MFNNCIAEIEIDEIKKMISEFPFTEFQKINFTKKRTELFPQVDIFTKEQQWILILSIYYSNKIYLFTHLCTNPPVFLLKDVFNVIETNQIQHQFSPHLVDHVLNQNGLKGYGQILQNIFLEEIQLKLERDFKTDKVNLFKDYLYLFQRTLNSVRHLETEISLVEEESRSYFYDLLEIEKSLLELNHDFVILYFLLSKKNIPCFVGIIGTLIKFYESKVNHHMFLLKNYMNFYKNKLFFNSMSRNRKANKEFESIVVYLENLNNSFQEISSLAPLILEEKQKE